MASPKETIKMLIKAGYKQKDISAHTGIPASTINKILKGITKSPRWQVVESLNSFLDTVNLFEDENI